MDYCIKIVIFVGSLRQPFWLHPFRLKCTIVITRCQPSVRHKLFTYDFSSESEERHSTKLVFFRSPGLWLARTFSTSLLKPLNGIKRNLTGSKISTSSTKFVFLGPIGKTKLAAPVSDRLWCIQYTFNKMTAAALVPYIDELISNEVECIGLQRLMIGWDNFDFSSKTA